MNRPLYFSTMTLIASSAMSLQAQTKADTLQWWDLASYSATTVGNLAADPDHWTPMSKSGTLQRYSNAVVTDGQPLTANGTIIAETQGLLFGAGIEAGSLLLRHNMGSGNNGVQLQRTKPVTLSGLKAGQTVVVTLKSSSSTAQGIASTTNLEGECGAGTYTGTSFKCYTFTVVADGDASFTCSGGIVIRSIGVLQLTADQGEQPHTPVELPYAGEPYILDPEPLQRGAIATWTGSGMLVNWRSFYNDPADVTFNVYRDGERINNIPISKRTNWLDTGGNATSTYMVVALSGGSVVERSQALNLGKGYLDIELNRPEGGTTASGSYTYVPGDAMVGDVDGDHEYEIIMKWDPDNRKDNSESGVTGNVLIDCYRLDGTQLWRIDLGKNIRAGAHYTQLMVYDLDGDGRAEVACKTAPGTKDGKGNYVLMNNDDPEADYRGTYGGKTGIIITGPEYLTVFDGETGAERATTAYNPPRSILSSSDWGDSYGNRCERYLAAVAYLDGKHPSLVMCRGYYTAAYLWAVDFDGEQLTQRWLHASTTPGVGAYGEGAHSISVADVDGDGCDEIIYGACAIDNDGSLLYRTGLGHGDALHVGDFLPDRPGLEVMMVHEETSARYGIEMHDALTGEILSGRYTGSDVGRGLCADVDPLSRGCEYWSTAKFNTTADGKYNSIVFNCMGDSISTRRPSVNFRTFWDGDVQEETCETGAIQKWNTRTTSAKTLVDFVSKYGVGTNLIKATPNLQCDLFGDWREEVIYYDEATKSHLMIFSTPYPCDFAVPTLMHDHQYRMATVWQTAAYNQPPHLSYYLRDYVENPPVSGIESVRPEGLQHGSEVMRTYYNLYGQLIDKPTSGIVIVEVRYADGSCERRVVNSEGCEW